MTGSNISIERVLIVDDDPIVCALAEIFFRARGSSQVETAANGREALDRLSDANGEFDFFLCDLSMPELDGLQLLRHLKQCEFAGSFAILSGMDPSIVKTSEVLATSYDLNLIGSLPKPFNHSQLDRLIWSARLQASEGPSVRSLQVTQDDLEAALQRDQIVPFYQPKIDLETGEMTGAEALARWLHPEFGLIQPDDFIPVAEQSGLIRELTDVIIQRAIDDVCAWQRHGIDPKISINLSPGMLNRLELPDEVAGRVDAAGLDRSRFTFEITESRLLKDDATTLEVLSRLRLLGFELSIDDFGTGYSNIDSLRAFPFTELKIDKSFVQNASHDGFARACIDASLRLARNLEFRVVAEGVEASKDWAYVSAVGIDEIQGQYIASPMPADAFLAWSGESDTCQMTA